MLRWAGRGVRLPCTAGAGCRSLLRPGIWRRSYAVEQVVGQGIRDDKSIPPPPPPPSSTENIPIHQRVGIEHTNLCITKARLSYVHTSPTHPHLDTCEGSSTHIYGRANPIENSRLLKGEEADEITQDKSQ